LRFRQTQIRRFGVEAIANHRPPAAVVAMTDGAMIREMKPRVAQILRRGEQGILGQPRIRRDRELTRIASYHNFESSWRGARAEPIMQERSSHSDNEAKEDHSDDDNH